MPPQSVWQQGSHHPENANSLATIQQWWSSLNHQEIFWQQRLIPQNGDLSSINWEPQRFDERFVIAQPQIRGITLYWRKPGSADERNTTPRQLELDTLHQILWIYPQSQAGVIIRVERAQVQYQKIVIHQPQMVLNHQKLLLRDPQQQLEIEVHLSPANLQHLKQGL